MVFPALRSGFLLLSPSLRVPEKRQVSLSLSIYIYICTYVYMCTCIYIYIYICICVYIYIYIHRYNSLSLSLYDSMCVHVYMSIRVCYCVQSVAHHVIPRAVPSACPSPRPTEPARGARGKSRSIAKGAVLEMGGCRAYDFLCSAREFAIVMAHLFSQVWQLRKSAHTHTLRGIPPHEPTFPL